MIEALLRNWEPVKETVEDYLRREETAGETGRRAWRLSELPAALAFYRTPYKVSFELGAAGAAPRYRILAVNCHLRYGRQASSRRNEFELLVNHLVAESETRIRRNSGYEDILLLGDLNLDYDRPERDRPRVDKLFAQVVPAESSQAINFPFLDVHPDHDAPFRSNLRRSQSYSQIGLIAHDPRLPTQAANKRAGFEQDGFDYGVFDFAELVLRALSDGGPKTETKSWQVGILKKLEFDVSDHLPIWIRLPMPSAPAVAAVAPEPETVPTVEAR